MSGGHFNYEQYKIEQIADEVEQIIISNNGDKIDQHGYRIGYSFSEETIAEFKKGLDVLRQARIYAQRIDWLVSGDDGEDSFHTRLKKDLENNTND
jgi:hypothetical protein